MQQPAPPTGIEHAETLAQAIVDTIREPLLVLDRDLRIVLASRSFYSAFHTDPEHTFGLVLTEMGAGEWGIPSLQVFLDRASTTDAIIEAYEIEQTFPVIGHRILLVNARKVFYESRNSETILVAIEDITDRRAAERERDELLRQKEMLLEEMQHRVSNSLQIIASILLMKARSVSSEETRAHLHDAHSRVLAVAAVQQHLHASPDGEVIHLNPYLTELCTSLAGAMVPSGPDPITIKVQIANRNTSSAIAVSVGLIVTELVINALKHAFPEDKPGSEILITYDASEAAAVDETWTLTVADNGIGKARDEMPPAKGGLGTSIVAALADQLGATVSTRSDDAGTSVSITHALQKAA